MLLLKARWVTLALGLCVVLGCSPPDGAFTDTYSNGTRKTSGFYKNGEKTGTWAYHWTNGEKQVEGQYQDGKQIGTWKYYNKQGKVIAEGTYKNGKMWNGTFVRYIVGTKKVMRFSEGKERTR